MKIPLYLFLNVFRKVFFSAVSIVQQFVLKAEWFGFRDCATMTVVYILKVFNHKILLGSLEFLRSCGSKIIRISVVTLAAAL